MSIDGNPLLKESRQFDGAVAFDDIKLEHYLPALEHTLQIANQRLEKLKVNTAKPSIENTLLALQKAINPVVNVVQIYGNLRIANGDDALQALAGEIMPKVSALMSDINLDDKIFARVNRLYENTNLDELPAEARTLIEQTYRSFKRNGGLLNHEDKQKLRAIDQQLSTLSPEFSSHVLNATNSFELRLSKKEDLQGLPDSAIEAAKVAATEKGYNGEWLFTLHAPSLVPFLKYSTRRNYREQLWRAYNTRAVDGDNSNKDLIRKITGLRYERAQLLGYDSHAAYQLEERMAETPDKVNGFLTELYEVAKPAAIREVQELTKFKREQGDDTDLMPWDYTYWSHRMKEAMFQLDSEALKPYFPLKAVLEGAFAHANKLFGLRFNEAHDVPVYHPEVQAFKAYRKDAYVGLFYVDFHPRSTKSGGAWATRYRDQYKEEGRDVRPHVSIVCNFTKPSGDKPALLNFMEVTTLFHEFGHALHSLLSDCQFQDLSCTSVFRDFVELPSQIMENWTKEEEGLALFARHYETQEVLPMEMVEKIRRSDNFHSGYGTMRQLRFAMIDMAWHTAEPGSIDDVEEFEAKVSQDADILPKVDGCVTSCSFEHIFAGGYAAGYYGYKWAEVLDADAFELFKENGIFDTATAESFRVNILSKGGSEHPMKLYKKFRGREPSTKALLRRCELVR